MSRINFAKLRKDTASLMKTVKTLALGRPIQITKPKFDKAQWEREYIRACEQDELYWRHGKPEDIDTER